MVLKVPNTEPGANPFAPPVPRTPLQFGEMPWELPTGDYRQEREVVVPHQLIARVGRREPMTTTIERVDWNASLLKTRFTLPAEIATVVNGGTGK